VQVVDLSTWISIHGVVGRGDEVEVMAGSQVHGGERSQRRRTLGLISVEEKKIYVVRYIGLIVYVEPFLPFLFVGHPTW
jgi:hypothetical protein